MLPEAPRVRLAPVGRPVSADPALQEAKAHLIRSSLQVLDSPDPERLMKHPDGWVSATATALMRRPAPHRVAIGRRLHALVADAQRMQREVGPFAPVALGTAAAPAGGLSIVGVPDSGTEAPERLIDESTAHGRPGAMSAAVAAADAGVAVHAPFDRFTVTIARVHCINTEDIASDEFALGYSSSLGVRRTFRDDDVDAGEIFGNGWILCRHVFSGALRRKFMVTVWDEDECGIVQDVIDWAARIGASILGEAWIGDLVDFITDIWCAEDRDDLIGAAVWDLTGRDYRMGWRGRDEAGNPSSTVHVETVRFESGGGEDDARYDVTFRWQLGRAA